MSNQPQSTRDPEFLEGIDEQFQTLMKGSGSGKRSGRSNGRNVDDPFLTEIMDHLRGLSKTQREQVLVYLRSLKQKVE